MHHKAKAPFAAVLMARWLYDNVVIGYKRIADLINEEFAPRELDQDWDKPRPKICSPSTVRDWINETRAYS
jgi:hypothetical protein